MTGGSAKDWPRAAGVAAGLALDLVAADPRRGHPVAGFGALALGAERRVYRDSRSAGVVYALSLVATAAGAGALLDRLAPGRGGRTVGTALVTWTVLGGTTLRREATGLATRLEAGELAAARWRLSHLCGRDPADLDAAELARATVESVAENTSDAVVGPLVWAALAGLPGMLAYRAVNTLDAMVGHRSERYERFGWAAARLDDGANLLPARLTAALTVLLAPVVGGGPAGTLRVWRRDGGKHPSPNAGPVEAAFAGALGRTLGGQLAYAGRVEERPLLGNGPAPAVSDIARATRLSAAVQATAGALCLGWFCLAAWWERP